MSRRKRPQPEHRNPHEQRLREIVDEIVPDGSQKQAYLAFALELAVVERSSSFVHRPSSVIPRERSDSRNLAADQIGRDPSIPLGMTKGRDPSTSVGVTGPMSERPRPFPDFSMRTKRVVQKYFERGLRGNLLWLIGEAVLNRG